MMEMWDFWKIMSILIQVTGNCAISGQKQSMIMRLLA